MSSWPAQMTPGDESEVLLHGGTTNRGRVTRVGDTVRRPVRPTSRSTWALLRHLEDVGFAGAPRFVGVDRAGREVLSYVEGDVATPPYPAWALSERALTSVAELLRDYHAAVASFDASAHEWGRPLPPRYRGPLVTHNDPNLDNVVFRDGVAVSLIDFDLAAPGTALWDVACAARLWAPLRDRADSPLEGEGDVEEDSLRRLRVFVDAYGLSADDREHVAGALLSAHAWCYGIVQDAVTHGHESFTPYWVQGGAAQAERTRTWLFAHRREVRAALVP
ncbi:phosphotransferase [Motilibacter peucedani]|uniref:phosphotransferase n=1 Tax=Motilibacter peucedani TaxID=598650 RepID=UPI001E38C447|nr:phosphotransferase [Motilibacter peucedani]